MAEDLELGSETERLLTGHWSRICKLEGKVVAQADRIQSLEAEVAALKGVEDVVAIDGYVEEMREQEPSICWRLLQRLPDDFNWICIKARGHDDGAHEPAKSAHAEE